MARPALIIGLGGTGQWVLTYLKRELIEASLPDRNHPENLRSNGLPKGVRFLAFDTVQQRVLQDKGKEVKELGGDVRRRKVGSIELEGEQKEYIYFGDTIRPSVNLIWNNDLTADQNPYEPQKWLKESYPTFINLGDGVMNASDGAGAIRQVGRLALINDIRKSDSEILDKITNAIQEIGEEVGAGGIDKGNADNSNYNRRLEVVFVSSLAGGTGAGIFIDIALWCHQIIDAAFPGATVFRAFLVSPFAFTSPGPTADTDKMVRSFAAWRELNRFLTIGQQNQSGLVSYDGLDKSKQINLQTRLFDVTYMIDPNREGNPLKSGHPDKNLYPSIAQAIAGLLDPDSGGIYSQQAINLSGDIANKDAHCAFGCYTIKVPIYYHWQKFTTTLGKETFDKLFVPTFDDGGHVIGVSGSANSEHIPSDIGRQAVVNTFLKANFQYGNSVFVNTKFWQNVANCLHFYWHKDEGKINVTAQGFPRDGNWGVYGSGGILDSLSAHREGNNILTERNRNSEDRLLSDLVPLTTLPLIDVQNNPRIIERVMIDHYSETNENPGSFKKSLKKAGDAQFELFASYIRAFVEQEMNGASADPKTAKSGKIGWVKEFLIALRDGLGDYDEFCKRVLDRSAAQDITGRTNANADLKFRDFRSMAGKKAWLTWWDNNTHPKAHDAERAYYYSQQALANLKRESILFAQHRDTVAMAQKFINNSIADLEAWIKVLVTGGSYMDKGQPQVTQGVYDQVKMEGQSNQAEFEETQSEQSQMEYVGEVKYPVIQVSINDNLAKVNWRVSIAKNYSGLLFDLDWNGMMDNGRTADGKYDLGTGVRKSHDLVLSLCEIPFIQLITKNAPNTIFNELKKKYKDGDEFGTEIKHKADPYWRMTTKGKGPFAPKSGDHRTGLVSFRTEGLVANSVAENADGQEIEETTPAEHSSKAQSNPFTIAMMQSLGRVAGVKYNNSERMDPFTFTFIRNDNVILSKDFNVYEECKNAYMAQYLSGDARGVKTNLEQYHTFPAEVHAAQYEREIAELLRQNFTLMEPETVALLDYKDRIDDFFKAVALGIIRRQLVKDASGQKGYTWVHQLGKGTTTWLSELERTAVPDNTANPYKFLVNRVVYKSNDIREGVNQVNRIDWKELHIQIWNAELDHSATPLYKNQYAIPEDVAGRKDLLEKAGRKLETGATNVVWPILADFAVNNEVDLAHLCELTLRKANHEPIKGEGHAVI